MNTLISRSQILADQERRDTEMTTIRNTLIANPYTHNSINRTIRATPKLDKQGKVETQQQMHFYRILKEQPTKFEGY